MTKLKKLLKEKKEALDVLDKIQDSIRVLESKTKVECTSNNYGDGCGKKHQVRKLQYIKTYWYSLDDWNEGEGNFICPACGHRNRLYDREEIQDLKYLFDSIIDEYGD